MSITIFQGSPFNLCSGLANCWACFLERLLQRSDRDLGMRLSTASKSGIYAVRKTGRLLARECFVVTTIRKSR